MAHPSRGHKVDRLLNALGADVPVSWDGEGPPSRDRERLWRNARNAWGMYDPNSQWHLLLQDDALPAAHLLEVLPEALSYVQGKAVCSLYVGTGRPTPLLWKNVTQKADTQGAHWIVGPRIMWGVAIVMPTKFIPEMVEWADKQYGVADDMRVGRWARRDGFRAWFTWPSLVDHEDEPSLLGHSLGRVARRHVADARGINWGAGVVGYA